MWLSRVCESVRRRDELKEKPKALLYRDERQAEGEHTSSVRTKRSHRGTSTDDVTTPSSCHLHASHPLRTVFSYLIWSNTFLGILSMFSHHRLDEIAPANDQTMSFIIRQPQGQAYDLAYFSNIVADRWLLITFIVFEMFSPLVR